MSMVVPGYEFKKPIRGKVQLRSQSETRFQIEPNTVMASVTRVRKPVHCSIILNTVAKSNGCELL